MMSDPWRELSGTGSSGSGGNKGLLRDEDDTVRYIEGEEAISISFLWRGKAGFAGCGWRDAFL